jgi:hypothetical protein
MSDIHLTKVLEKYASFVNANVDDKVVIYNFFDTIMKDFDTSYYELEKIIKNFLENPSKYISYYSIFNELYEYGHKIESLSSDLDKFEKLLIKYNNVALVLPFEVSSYKYYFSSYIYQKITKRDRFLKNDTSCNNIFKMLKVIVKYLPKCTDTLISNRNDTHYVGPKLYNQVVDDDFDFDIDSFEHNYSISSEDILKAKTFKLLIENSVYNEDTFSNLLSFLYFRQDMLGLEIIKNLRPELLSINLVQLIKIVFYGRHLVLQFVLDNLFDQFKQLTEQYNIYNIALLKDHGKKKRDMVIEYIDDIWNGWSWHNDEHEKPHVSHSDFDKVFELISSNSTCIFDRDLIKLWLKIVLKHDEGRYFIKKDKLILMLSLNISTKEGIKEMVDTIGYSSTWIMLQECNSDVLKLLLE